MSSRALIVVFLVACGGSGQPSLSLEVGGSSSESSSAGTVERVDVIATYQAANVSAATQFDVSDPSAGHFEGATFVSAPNFTGAVDVLASYAGEKRTLGLTLVSGAVHGESGNDDWLTPVSLH